MASIFSGGNDDYGQGGGFGGMSNSLIGLGMGFLQPYNPWAGTNSWTNALQGYQAGAALDQRTRAQQQELAMQRERMAMARAQMNREPEAIRQLRAANVPQEKWAEYLYPKQDDYKLGSVTYREQDYPYRIDRQGNVNWLLGPPGTKIGQPGATAAPAAVPFTGGGPFDTGATPATTAAPVTTGAGGAAAPGAIPAELPGMEE